MRFAVPTFRTRCIGALAVTAFLFVVGTGAAFADPASHPGNYYAKVAVGTRPDNRAGIHGALAPSFMSAPAAVRPDDRAGVLGPGVVQSIPTAVRPDDRGGIHGIGVPESAPVSVATPTSGFQWLDAGIGALGAFALILAAGGVFLAAGRRHGPSSAPSALHG
jgi:hypothetical protein